MKKTIFSKIFINNIFSSLIAIFVLSVTMFALMSNYMLKASENQLKRNARDIELIVKNGVSMEYLSTFLKGFSKSVNRDIIIIDSDCNILMYSVVTEDFEENTKKIPEQYCREVLSGKENVIKGTMGELYEDNMFTLQIPMIDIDNKNNVLGAIMIGMPFPETRKVELQILKICLMSMLLVIIIAFIMSYALSKRISIPIRQITGSVKKFSQENLNERINLKKNIYNIEELRELADTFNTMADEIEKSDSVKNNFISDVSHELRTPMTTISGFVDGILDDTIPKERQRDYLLIVKDEMGRLVKLVNDFLDITRHKNMSSDFKMKDFDIAEMIRMSVIGLESKIEAKKIDVELDFEYDSVVVNANYDSIKRVITNLLDNAVKFTYDGGKIIISAEKKKQEIVIGVYNTGVGISEKDKPYIFKRFYKADKSRSENREGNGIGLFFVNDIINRHGKSISVESEEGKYAKFTFSLNCGKS